MKESDIMTEKLIRDALGSPIPQYFNLDLQMFAVETIDGSVVTDIDFSKIKLLRDHLGSPIPQLWDTTNNKWVMDTSQARNITIRSTEPTVEEMQEGEICLIYEVVI